MTTNYNKYNFNYIIMTYNDIQYDNFKNIKEKNSKNIKIL